MTAVAPVERPLVVLPTYNEAANIAEMLERISTALPAMGTRARPRALVQMDSDFQHDPDAIPSLLAALERGADMAIGSRYVEGGSIPTTWPWFRQTLSRWGNRYASALLRLGVHDATAGFRAHRAAFIHTIDLDSIDTDGYGFQVQLTYRARRAGGVIAEVPIAFGERVRGDSKMSGRIILEAFIMATRLGLSDRVRRELPPHDSQ